MGNEITEELLSIDEKIKANAGQVLLCVDRLLSNNSGESNRLQEAMRYSALNGGKCLRSFFFIEAVKAFGIQEEDIIEIAASIEIIHSYSLIHDDLPAMDNDDLRRGKPSCHKQYNEATAILAGDALLTLAFEILSSDKIKLSAEQKLSIINTLARSIGYSGMAGGQMRDIIFEKCSPGIAEILEMQRMKTAHLFAACAACASIVAKLPEEKFASMVSYGFGIGLAFQIVDDLLDVICDEEQLGKKTGKDLEKGKAALHNFISKEETFEVAGKVANWAEKQLIIQGICFSVFKEFKNFIIARRI